MKVSTTLVLAAALAGSSLLAAPPQTSEPTSIAIINGDRVLEGSNIGRQARERLEAAAAVWEERVSAVNGELSTLTRQRQDQAMALNEAAMMRLNQDIEERQVQLQRLNDDARRELTRLEQQVTVDVNTRLGPLIEQFAKQRNLDLILDSARMQGMLYFKNSRDLTDDFLALVNSVTPAPSQQ